MAREHDHEDHGHGHGHHHAPPEGVVVRVKALENLMISHGLIDPAAIDEIVDHYENRIASDPARGTA